MTTEIKLSGNWNEAITLFNNQKIISIKNITEISKNKIKFSLRHCETELEKIKKLKTIGDLEILEKEEAKSYYRKLNGGTKK